MQFYQLIGKKKKSYLWKKLFRDIQCCAGVSFYQLMRAECSCHFPPLCSTFPDMLVVRNQPWLEYLHDEDWTALYIKKLFMCVCLNNWLLKISQQIPEYHLTLAHLASQSSCFCFEITLFFLSLNILFFFRNYKRAIDWKMWLLIKNYFCLFIAWEK